jgi:hypothetical protein
MIRVLRSMSDEIEGKERLSLTLFLRDLHVGIIGEVAIPVELAVENRIGRWECGIEIHAVSDEGIFPTFNGNLSISPVGAHCELWLIGEYRPPFGPVGEVVDDTVLRHAAQRSLQAFLSRIAMEILDDVRREESTHRRDVRGMQT